MIKWLAHKYPNWDNIKTIMKDCEKNNQYTNIGPVIPRLEGLIRDLFKIEEHKAVILSSNGTTALHALVAGLNIYRKKELLFVTQAFTFPSARQGPLRDSLIIDIDPNHDQYGIGPSFREIQAYKGVIDGIIVTNVHGNLVNIDEYESWATRHNKYLIFDNAATGYSFFKGKNSCNYGTGAIISFHHTKPFGFGEGGCVIVDREYEKMVRLSLNFGLDNSLGKASVYSNQASNYRMCDINASFIMSFLQEKFEDIVKRHREIYMLVQEECPAGYRLFPNFSDDIPVCSSICLIKENTDQVIDVEKFPFIARKYYKPLDRESKWSWILYDNIVCLPCNIDLTDDQIRHMLNYLADLTAGMPT